MDVRIVGVAEDGFAPSKQMLCSRYYRLNLFIELSYFMITYTGIEKLQLHTTKLPRG